MSVSRRVLALVLLCLFAALTLLPLAVRQTKTLVGPENKVYNLLLDNAPDTDIMLAAKADLAGTLSFCDHGETLLGVAVEKGRLGVVRGLLDLGASPNGPTGGGGSAFEPPLITAVIRGDNELVSLLLEHGADPRLPSSMFGITAESSARNTPSAAVKSLIQAATRTSTRPANDHVRELLEGS